ncbi:MAG: hypothetical protein ACFHWX_13975 [Bacteroidota bacterium]
MSIFRTLFLIVVFTMINLSLNGQTNPNIQEEVRMHLNNSTLITGETLLFSADIVSAQTNKFSNLSAILYVEIINEKYEPIWQAKVSVREGKGFGDFFIPSLIRTGSYQLIAYTRWMRNFNQYYHHPLKIINPFEAYNSIPESEKLNITFYPEGGSLVRGVENTIVVSLKDYQEKGVEFKGRIVDQEGNMITNVKSGLPGFALFSYTPETDLQYQMIVEDPNGNFQFFDLPKAQINKQTIQVNVRENDFLTQIACDCEETFQLQVYQGQRKILEKSVQGNSEISLSKYELGKGTFLFRALLGGVNISERLVYNHAVQNYSSELIPRPIGQRSLVTLPIQFKEGTRFSISVNKVQEYGIPVLQNLAGKYLNGVNELHNFNTELLFDPKSQELINMLMIASSWKYEEIPTEIHLLPDHRGEIVSGRVEIPDSIQLEKGIIAYSIIGTEYQVKMASIDENDKFQMVVESLEEDRTAYITSMDNLSADLIELDQQFLSVYPRLEFPPIILDSTIVKGIVQRSIRNQIENAYYEVKADSIPESAQYIEQFSHFDYFYVLDKYNRFPTIRESFIEYIPAVAVRGRDTSAEFKLLLHESINKPLFEPYAFLDGLPVNSDEIISFSPYRIESIGVINNRYFLGPAIIDGVISFRTKEGDLQGFTPGPQSRRLSYTGVKPIKNYTFPVYGISESGWSDPDSRLPDFRDQLYWNPDVRIDASEAYNIEFFTSDTKGQFELVVEGITREGEPIMTRHTFMVE